MKTETNRAIETVNRHRKSATEILNRWKEKFEADPANAFEWADAAFRAAATRRVTDRALALFARGATVAEVSTDLRVA